MKDGLESHHYFRKFLVHVAAGGTTTGAAAKKPVDLMLIKGERESRRTITLSVAKLMTEVTVPQRGDILFFRSLQAPESYFQSAFRVQSPWTVRGNTGDLILKKDKCFVFDPERALSLTFQYGTKLASDVTKSNPAEVIAEMIDALPIFVFDGSRMDPVNVNEVMDWRPLERVRRCSQNAGAATTLSTYRNLSCSNFWPMKIFWKHSAR